MNAVPQWRYRPTLVGSQRVADEASMDFPFRLKHQ